ncbi:hypothetical protein AB4Z54_62555, partial [Streptomyces sp. MCAF7]
MSGDGGWGTGSGRAPVGERTHDAVGRFGHRRAHVQRAPRRGGGRRTGLSRGRTGGSGLGDGHGLPLRGLVLLRLNRRGLGVRGLGLRGLSGHRLGLGLGRP